MCRKRSYSVLVIAAACTCIGVWLYYEFKHPEWRLTELSSNVNCTAKFGKTWAEDIQKIQSYPLSSVNHYLRQLDPVPSPRIFHSREGQETGVEIPVLVSGASSNHYEEGNLFIYHLNSVVRPSYPSVPFYFFDLGMKHWQTQKISQTCNCTVVKFPFHKYPAHIKDMLGFCWKPLLMKMVLQTHRFTMWMDTSTRFQTSNLDNLFRRAQQQGVMASLDKHSIASHTHQDTFSFLQEAPCLFKDLGEFQGGLVLIHSGNTTVYEYLLQPWVACALIEDCMKTRHYSWWIIGCKHGKHYHECHRSDMSVLSILMYRLFHNYYRDHAINKHYFRFDRLEHKWFS